MIDHPDQVDWLLTRLRAALPLPARVTPVLATALRKGRRTPIPSSCSIIAVSYAGDEGGILCQLDFADEKDERAFVSITHLRFEPSLLLARDIASYQKHRVKRLRKQPA